MFGRSRGWIWTKSYKKKLLNSRVDTTKLLFEKIKDLKIKPESFISASAIGYYKLDTLEPQEEKDLPGKSFLSKLVQEWEDEISKFKSLKVRTTIFRIGLVFSKKGGIRFFTFFYISGVPFYMHPLLIPIEVISYLSRPISLSVRLFANMLAGHTLLKVFAGFVVAMPFFTGALPLAFIVALTGLEILIAFLQAYVFAILTCLYINDAYHLH